MFYKKQQIHTPKKPFKSKKNPTKGKGGLQMSQYSDKLPHFVKICTFQKKKSHGSEKSENKHLTQA